MLARKLDSLGALTPLGSAEESKANRSLIQGCEAKGHREGVPFVNVVKKY